MKTGFLTEQDVAQVHGIMAQHGVEQFEASVRFWSRGKSIDVAGPLDEKHLNCLLEIARALNLASEPEPVAQAA